MQCAQEIDLLHALHTLQSVGVADGDADGAETKLDSVREAIRFSHLTPQLAESKVVLLKEAHCLNRSAGNALLKTLEEPPPSTFLILSSSLSSSSKK